jgi:sulfite exporter TauE/SafE
MCGPLLLALPFNKQSTWSLLAQKFAYQTGRISMYGILGFLLGGLGSFFNFLGLQQILSLLTGCLLLIAGISYFVHPSILPTGSLLNKLSMLLANILGRYLNKPYGGLVAGAVNGLLPCGVTYIAIAQAINLNTQFESITFMIFFGLGTLPLLLLTSLSPFLFRKLRVSLKVVPLLLLIAGSFLIARGLNLEIPFVSHTINSATSCQ